LSENVSNIIVITELGEDHHIVLKSTICLATISSSI